MLQISTSIVVMLILAVMGSVITISAASPKIENLTSEQSNILSRVISSFLNTLVDQAEISFHIMHCSMIPAGSSGGAIHNLGKTKNLKNGSVTVPDTFLIEGSYPGLIGELHFYSKGTVSIFLAQLPSLSNPWGDGLFAVSLQTDTERTYIVTLAKAAGEVVHELKKLTQSEKREITISKATLEEGSYWALNGLNSAIILDKDRRCTAIMSEWKGAFDLHIATKAIVIGTFTRDSGEGKLLGGGKVTFSKAILKEGTYEAFNGSDSAFIFDKGVITAILVKGNGVYDLYIATSAAISETPPVSTLKSGTYRALIGSKFAFILDATTEEVTDVSLDFVE